MSAVMAERPIISATVVDDWIRTWKVARLSKDIDMSPLGGFLGRMVDLGPAAMFSGRYGHRILAFFGMSQIERDAKVVQDIVDRMPDEMRDVFEAYHLAIIRGERCRDWPHKARALALGIPSPTTYFRRKDAGWHYVAERLPRY